MSMRGGEYGYNEAKERHAAILETSKISEAKANSKTTTANSQTDARRTAPAQGNSSKAASINTQTKSSNETATSDVDTLSTSSASDTEAISSKITDSTPLTSLIDAQEDPKGLPVIGDDTSLRLRAVKIEHLIEAFSSEISRGVAERRPLDGPKIARISGSLPRLLKEFSQEMAEIAESAAQRQATKFVRRYRR
jgi:hypothetical protein